MKHSLTIGKYRTKSHKNRVINHKHRTTNQIHRTPNKKYRAINSKYRAINSKSKVINNQNNAINKYSAISMLIYGVLILITAFLSIYEIQKLQADVMANKILHTGINYDAMRAMELDVTILNQSEYRMQRLLNKHPELKGYPYMDPIGYLAYSMLANDFHGLDKATVTEQAFLRGMTKVAVTSFYAEIYDYYRGILLDLEYFPVPKLMDGEADISYVDTWNGLRSYGGKRRHEGTDLMALNNTRGYYPVISITDGVIENLGWLEQGGWRIGVRAPEGGYFYYAHLDSFAPNVKAGDTVIAGQLLGFMGDSGYGEEGTIGNFDVHLHMGIYVQANTGEMSINPYQILKILEKNRTVYSYFNKNISKP